MGDIEFFCVISRQDDGNTRFADQFVIVARWYIGPPAEGLPALKWNAEYVTYPQLHTWMLSKPVREFSAAIEVGFEIAQGADLGELVADCVPSLGCYVASGVVIEADDYVAAVAGGEVREYGPELPLRRHLACNLRRRHCRLLDLKARSGARYEIAAKFMVIDVAVDIQTAIGCRMGTGPPDGADRGICHP